MQLLLALLPALGSCVGFVECTSKSKIIGGWHISIKDAPYHVGIARLEYCHCQRVVDINCSTLLCGLRRTGLPKIVP